MGIGDKVHRYRGHYIYPGRLRDSDDDVLGAWYVVHQDSDEVDTRGRGHETLKAARESINGRIESACWGYKRFLGEWMAVGTVEDREWAGCEIIVGTARGEKHVRRVVEVAYRHLPQSQNALTYVRLESDSQIEHRATTGLITARVDRVLNELDSWQRHFNKTHTTAISHQIDQRRDALKDEVLSAFGSLLEALEAYRTYNEPRKHPSPAWLAETRRIKARSTVR